MNILKFKQTFDIDRIKDRSEHKYFEGEEAEKRIVDYIIDNQYEDLISVVCELFNIYGEEKLKKAFNEIKDSNERELEDHIRGDIKEENDEI